MPGRPGACLGKMDEAHLVIAIVAYRYGWLQIRPAATRKSITWEWTRSVWGEDFGEAGFQLSV